MPKKLFVVLAFGLLQALYAGTMVAEPDRADRALWPSHVRMGNDFWYLLTSIAWCLVLKTNICSGRVFGMPMGYGAAKLFSAARLRLRELKLTAKDGRSRQLLSLKSPLKQTSIYNQCI